jgi:hypothetical protein
MAANTQRTGWRLSAGLLLLNWLSVTRLCAGGHPYVCTRHCANCSAACPACAPFYVFPPPSASEAGSLTAHVQRAELVIAQCKNPMAWLPTLCAIFSKMGVRVVRITLYPKCAGAPALASTPLAGEPQIRTVQLPNVGREGHTWMHHVAANYEELADVVLFLKDSTYEYRIKRLRRLAVPAPRVLERVRTLGFACARRTEASMSVWHVTETLFRLRVGGYSTYTPNASTAAVAAAGPPAFGSSSEMGGFLRRALGSTSVDALLRHRFFPVCYGGSFGATASRLQMVPRQTWARIEALLSRGDNIEEGHFTERLWAGLLLPPMAEPASAAFAAGVREHYIHGKQIATMSHYAGIVQSCCCGARSWQ